MPYPAYGDMKQDEIVAMVSSPKFPEWCAEMERRLDAQIASLASMVGKVSQHDAERVHKKALETHRGIDMQLMLATGDDLDARKERMSR